MIPFFDRIYSWYLRRSIKHIPTHVAIIQDGNRRFASSIGKSISYGHYCGAKTTENIITWILKLNIRHLTLFTFSTENFRRSEDEKKALRSLFLEKIFSLKTDPRISKYEINVSIIGDRSLIDAEVLDHITQLENQTKHYSRYYVHIAVAYGGRNEIVRVTKKVSSLVNNGTIQVDDISPSLITSLIYPNDAPPMLPVDLLIRTANEYRTSNFLFWLSNGCSSTVYFSKPTWPEFRYIDLLRAIKEYNKDLF